MSDEANAPVGGDEPVAAISPANLDAEPMSEAQAYEAYIAKKSKPAESAQAATAEQELPEKGNAEPAEEQPSGEEPEVAEPEEELPPIEPPRSWTKEEKEEFQTYPRAAQEKIAAREQARETALRRTQNEAAETRKAAEALQVQAEQARKAYEAKLPEVERHIQDFLSHQYPDIKSMADVERMAAEDPLRKIQWDTHQQKIASVMQEAQQAKDRQARDRVSNLNKYQAEETDKLAEFVPDVKDPVKLAALTTKAIDHLKSFDYSDKDLATFADQGEKPFIYSAGFQRILLNSLKYEELQKSAPKAIPKNVPPVQRPGVAPAKGAARTENLQALSRNLSESGSVDDAFALYQARRARRT
jgi:hypothetical protein